MNRREFTRGLASVGLAPIVPTVPVVATSAKATADHMYFVSWYTARLSKTCSAGQLVRDFDVDPSVAKEILARLVRDNTVSAPDAFGISRTLNPFKNPVAQARSLGAGAHNGQGSGDVSWRDRFDQWTAPEPAPQTPVEPPDTMDAGHDDPETDDASPQSAEIEKEQGFAPAPKQDIEA